MAISSDLDTEQEYKLIILSLNVEKDDLTKIPLQTDLYLDFLTNIVDGIQKELKHLIGKTIKIQIDLLK